MKRTSKESPTEGQYAGKLRTALLKYYGANVVIFKVHGGPFQTAGVSDLLLCLNGRYVALELKRPGEEPTDLQAKFIADVRRAGGYARVVFTNEDIDTVALLLDLEVRKGG